MRIIKKLLVFAVLICFFLAGCESDTGYIVRHDIQEDEVDYLYENMPENEVFEVFGLPYKTNDFGVITYYYMMEYFDLQLDMVDKKLVEATVYKKDDVERIDLPENEEKIIIKNQYVLPIKQGITESEIEFITDTSTTELVQKKLGPPHSVKAYHCYDGFLINSFVYRLIDGNSLRVIYNYHGTVGRAWVEDAQGNETEVLVELEGE